MLVVSSTYDRYQSILTVGGSDAVLSLLWEVVPRRVGETNPFCL